MNYLLASLIPVLLYAYSRGRWSEETQQLLSYLSIPFLVILAFYSLLLAIMIVVFGFIWILIQTTFWPKQERSDDHETIVVIRHHDRFF